MYKSNQDPGKPYALEDILDLDTKRPYEINPSAIFTTRLAKQILVDIPPKVARMPDIPLSYQDRTGIDVTTGGLSGSLENRGIIADKSLEWNPSKRGYDPQKIIAHLQSAELVKDWEDLARQRKVYDSRIETAVLTAGKNLLRDFTACLEKSRGEGSIEQLVKRIEDIWGYKEGVLALAPYYGGDNNTEEGKASIQEYKGKAEKIWYDTATAVLTFFVRRLQITSTERFNPRQTPERLDLQIIQIYDVLSRYKIDSPKMNSVMDEMYNQVCKQAYGQLLPELIGAIKQPQAAVILDEIAVQPFTPSKEGSQELEEYIPISIGGGKGILYVPKGMDLSRPSRLVPAVPGQSHKDLAGRYCIEAKLTSEGKLLYTATRIEPGNEPKDNLAAILDDISRIFEYGEAGGVDVKELVKARGSMLQANEHRKRLLTDIMEMLQSEAYDPRIRERLLSSPSMIEQAINEAWKIPAGYSETGVEPEGQPTATPPKKRHWWDPRKYLPKKRDV